MPSPRNVAALKRVSSVGCIFPCMRPWSAVCFSTLSSLIPPFDPDDAEHNERHRMTRRRMSLLLLATHLAFSGSLIGMRWYFWFLSGWQEFFDGFIQFFILNSLVFNGGR